MPCWSTPSAVSAGPCWGKRSATGQTPALKTPTWRTSSGSFRPRVLPAENRIDEGSPQMKTLVPKPFWLIVKGEAGRMDVLTSRLASGEEALPVFSFEEEARMFLELGALGGDWHARVTSPGELISVLFAS